MSFEDITVKKLSSLFTRAGTVVLLALFCGMKITQSYHQLYPNQPVLVSKESKNICPLPDSPKNEPPKDIWLTVFVHGIMSVKPHINWNNFMNFFKDKVEGTLYEKTVQLIREDSFFFKNQAMQYRGLHEIDLELKEGNACASMGYMYDEIIKHYGIARNNKYYTFGWSGLLSAKARIQDAKDLFEQLEKEVCKLKKENYTPHIRLVSYSHGGNVALNLALIHKDNFPNSNLFIDELVLVGTPIVQESDYLINDPIFGKVFNVYSLKDRVQPLDLFAANQLFSERIFRPRKGFEVPKKLVQVQLKVTRCKESTIKNTKKFKHSKNLSNPSVVYGRTKLLRDCSPGHSELWFFGWTPMNYRKKFPMYPLPAAAMIPVITYHADKIRKDFKPETTIIADIRPQHNVVLFRERLSNKIHSTVPYIPQKKLGQITDLIMRCKPELYTPGIYGKHIEFAIKRADMFMKTPPTNQAITSGAQPPAAQQYLKQGPIDSTD